MAAPVPVARVSAVQGQAYAKGEDGALRSLRAGDFVYEGESVVTGAASSVELATMDGQPFHLGANEALTMDAEVVAQTAPDATDSAVKVSGDEFRRIATALSQGRSLDDLLEETAAGGTPGDAGGGPTFVRLLRISESVDPLNFEFETSRAGAADDLLSGGLGTARNNVAETDPAPEVTPNRSPLASQDAYAMREDGGSITLDPLANDSDSDGGTLTVASIAGVALTPGVAQAIAVTGGTVNVSATGVITFTPDANYNGTINIPYTISDGQGGTATGNQTITVTPVNDAPTIDVTANAFTEDAAGTIAGAVAGTFTTHDQDGDTLTVGWTGGSSPTDGGGHALYTLDAATGQVLLTQAGADYVNAGHTLPAIDLTVSDGSLTGQDSATPVVTLVNDAPVALATPAGGNEDTPITVSLSGTDVDGTIQGVTVMVLPPAGQGVLYLPDGITPVTAGVVLSPGDAAHLVFRPAPDFNGTVDIPFTVTDNGGAVSVPVTVPITVNPVNDAPTIGVTANAFTEDAAGTVAGAVAGTFTTYDPDGDTLTVGWTGGSSPTDGSGHALYALDAASGRVLLTQAGADYVNAGQLLPAIDLTVSDGSLTGQDSATPAVTLVNDPPVGVNDTIPVTEDTSVTQNVLGNDTDSEGDPLTITAASIDTDGNGTPDPLTLGLPTAIVDSSGKAIGTITVDANGDVTFTPAADYTGPVPSLTYTPNDGATDGTSATVSFGPIAPVNDAPTIDVTANAFTEDAAGTVAGAVAGTFTTHDQDGDTLTVGWTGGSSPTDGSGHALYTLDAVTGQVLLTQSGAEYINAGHTLPAIDLTVSDGSLTGQDSATPAVTLVNDPPVGVNDTIPVTEDTPVTRNVLGNDTDAEGDPLTITAASIDTDGDGVPDPLIFDTPTAIVDSSGKPIGTITVNSGGDVTFIPSADYTGPIPNLTYTPNDGTTDGASATVSFGPIAPVNDAPTIDVTANAFTEDARGTVGGAVAGTFTTHDPDGDALTVGWTGGSSPTDGSGHALYTLDAASGRVLLTQAGADYVNAGHTLPAIDLTVSDGSLTGQDSATPAVTLVNDAPVADSNSITVAEESTNTPLGLAAPTDIDSASLTITVTGLPTLGTVMLADGTAVTNGMTLTAAQLMGLQYDAPADYNGTDAIGSFAYSVSDGTTTVTGGTTITVTPVNDAPVALATPAGGNEDTPITVSLSGTDVDGTIQGVTVMVLPPAGQGVLYLPDGITPVTAGVVLSPGDAANLVFRPAPDFNGTVDIPFTVTDDGGAVSAPATASIIVNPVNDAPTIDVTANAFTEDARATAAGAVAGTFTTHDQDGDTLTVGWTGGSSPTDGGGRALYTLDAASGRVLLTQAGADYVNAGHTLPAIDLTVSDGSLTGQDSAIPAVTLVNDAPTIDVTANAFTEDAAGTIVGAVVGAVAGTFTTYDQDGDVLTVSWTGGSSPTDGGGHALYTLDAVTGRVLLTQAGADYVNAGQMLPAIDLTVSDGSLTGHDSATPAVTLVNDAPTIDVTANAFTEDAAGTVAGAVAGTFTTYDQDGDVLTVSWTGGSSPTDGSGHALYTLDATSGRVLLTQAGADYVNAGHTLPAIDLTVSDGSLTGHDSATPAVTLVNDAPVALATPAGGNEDTPITVSLSGTDVDGTIQGVTVTTLPPAGQGVLYLPDGITPVTAGVVLSPGDAAHLVFRPAPDFNGPVQLAFTVTDNNGAVSVPATASITVAPVNDAPILDLDADNSTAPGTGYATSYAVGSAAGVAIAAADTRITDVDSTLIHSATLHLADARAGDLLSAGALPSGLHASAYDAASGVLTISGDASLATYQAALGGILFSSTSAVSGTSERHVEVTVNDGAADSNVAATTITVGSPVTVTLSSTSASLATSLTGLRAEYYGYNDTRTSGNKTHTDDTRYGNLDSISDMRSIIDGRNGGTAVVGSITAAGSAAPDAVFRATDINYGEINGSLGTNASLTSGKLATFLHADAAAAASLSGSVGTTTDAGIRFIGYLDSPSGSYDIRIYSDDGFSLSIDGRSIASYDNIRSPGNSVVTNVDLAGGLHPIEILYWDQGGQAVLHIEFKPAGAPDSAYRDLGSGDLTLVSPQGMTLGALQDIIADPAHPGQYLVRTGQEYTGTIANDHITGSDGRDILHGGVGNDALNGGANDDTLDGGAGNDTLTGGLGSDVFAWHLGDQGTAGAPARDTVTDFSKSTAAGSDDVLNLKDLLQGEAHPSSGTGIGNLDHYLHFEKSGSNTIVHVSSDGRFSAADSAAAITGKEDLQIVLQAVDLTTAGTDQQIIQDLLTKGKLVTD